MELVIKIPEGLKDVFENRTVTALDVEEMRIAIKNGTPLPKGHGDIIDRLKIIKAVPAEEDNCVGMGMTYDEMYAYNDGIESMWDKLQNADTIIEADKESEE